MAVGNQVEMKRTACSLGSELLGDASLALLLVRSLSLDGGVSSALDDLAGQLGDPGCRNCDARPDDTCYSGHNGPLKCEEPHGRVCVLCA